MTTDGCNDDENSKGIAPHLRRVADLYVRDGDRLVRASAEDTAVARSYPTFEDKGPVIDGQRLTLMTKQKTYHANEKIAVIHVVEVTEPGRQVYVMGPKPVYGEYVDGKLATEPVPKGEDPLAPRLYSGAVLPSPAVDYNYDITTYAFSKPGVHRIEWKMGKLHSNVLLIEVAKKKA